MFNKYLYDEWNEFFSNLSWETEFWGRTVVGDAERMENWGKWVGEIEYSLDCCICGFQEMFLGSYIGSEWEDFSVWGVNFRVTVLRFIVLNI